MPGSYVLLAVSDSGCGMPPEVPEQIFEPFFTTKPRGQGTGLGMPTVYGIVKQNDGFVGVYSEVGRGTTVRIYFPRHEAPSGPGQTPGSGRRRPWAGGSETVLLVADEGALLDLGKRVLESLGYTVLAAGSPERALELAAARAEIHLLFTDVVMPGMIGRELWERLHAARPGLKCLYMSGYTANAIANGGILDEGGHFLPKPFALAEVAEKIRAVLDG